MKAGQEAGRELFGPERATIVIASFLCIRFGLAALTLPLLWPAARSGFDRDAWKGGVVLGVLLLTGFLLQMGGLEEVTPAVSAFLTSLYVLFTAAIQLIGGGRRPSRSLLVGAGLATFGAGFISGPPQVAFGIGEGLTVGCAVIFALHILATDHWTRRASPGAVTETSLIFVALGAGALLIAACASDGIGLAELQELVGTRDFLEPVLLSSFLATSLALSLMNTFQRELTPVRAAILYAIEPIWASLIAIAQGWAAPGFWLFVGGAALLAGNLVAELTPYLRNRKTIAA